jgi:hypothetical protein
MPKASTKEYVGFIYGGPLKASTSVFFHTTGNVVDYVKENLVPHYGDSIKGRFVPCEDASELYDSVLENARKHLASGNEPYADHIMSININNATTVLRESSGEKNAKTIKLDDTKKSKAKSKTKTKQTKQTKKSKKKVEEDDDSDDEDDDDDDDENDGNGDDEDDGSDDEGSDDDGSDNEGSDDEEEVKVTKKKGSKKAAPKKNVKGRGKKSNKKK